MIDWFLKDHEDKKLAEEIFTSLNTIVDEHVACRLNKMMQACALYGAGQSGYSYWSSANEYVNFPGERMLTFNVTKSCVDYLHNKVGKNRINPRVIAVGATYEQQQKCSKADRFLKGINYKLKLKDKTRKALLHSIVFGTGFIKCYIDDKDRLQVECVAPDEVYVDTLDGQDGNPNAIYQVKNVSKEYLKLQYPEYEETIDNSVSHLIELGLDTTDDETVLENVLVVEAWHKTIDDKPGKHIICLSNGVLFEEEWDRDYLPFVSLTFTDPLSGYYSNGLVEELADLQNELTTMMDRIQEAHQLQTAPKIFVNKNAKIAASDINNEISTIYEVDLPPGVPVNSVLYHISPQAIGGDSYQYVENIYNKMFATSGINAMHAASRKEPGIESGIAIREMNDLQTERFALLSQKWADLHREVYDLQVKLIHDEGSNETIKVFVDDGNSLEKITFSELDLNIDDISIEIYPASELPSKPEAKLQYIMELAANQLIDPQDIPSLLDLPDIRAYNQINDAPKKAVNNYISQVMRLGEDDILPAIEDFMDLGYLIKRAKLYQNHIIAEYGREGEADDKINKLSIVIERATAMMGPPPAALPTGAPQPQEGGQAAQGGVPPELAALMQGMG